MQTQQTVNEGLKRAYLITIPAAELAAKIDAEIKKIAPQVRMPGFRPGKVPANLVKKMHGEALHGQVVNDTIRESVDKLIRDEALRPAMQPEVGLNEDYEQGKDAAITVALEVLPTIEAPSIDGLKLERLVVPVTDAQIDEALGNIASQNKSYKDAPKTKKAAEGDQLIIDFVGKLDGVEFDGGSTERMPLILGQERLIPGFEDHLIGLRPGESTEFDITFPADYGETSLAGQVGRFRVDLRELREKVPPAVDDEFARSIGSFSDLEALRVEIQARLERNSLDRARHEFSDKIIEYAVANATLELPDILVDQEVEVMHDEFRAALARQGIAAEAYLKVVEKTEADLHAEFRPNAERRVKVLLVLSKVAEAEGVIISDADIDDEVRKARERYGNDRKTVAYFESARGRRFIRNTLRRSRVVEQLVDAWLAAHPDHPAIPHLEDDAPSAVAPSTAEVNAAIGSSDTHAAAEADAAPAAAR